MPSHFTGKVDRNGGSFNVGGPPSVIIAGMITIVIIVAIVVLGR
jgi:hypothetical protein